MNGIETTQWETRFFKDVEVGDEIPPLVKGPFRAEMWALFGSVHGDLCPGHFDHAWKPYWDKVNVKPPVAYGVQIAAFASQLMTDWIGRDGSLKKFKLDTRAPVYEKDSIIIKGKVTKKYIEENENFVECEILVENQDGNLVAKASAVVTLP